MQASEKRYAKAIQKMLIFKAGLAVAETPQAKAATLHGKALQEYEASLESFDPVSDVNLEVFSGKSYFFTVRDSHVDTLKTFLKQENLTGQKIWSSYGYIKSEIVNHWLPHWKMMSGWDVDDAVEHVRKHAWAFRANRTIKASNKQIAKQGGTNFAKEKTWEEAPEGTTGNVMLELPILKQYYDHPFLQVNTRERGEEKEEEEGESYSGITSTLAKRKEQRKKEKGRMMKQNAQKKLQTGRLQLLKPKI